MVTYTLVKQTDHYLVYQYFPEDRQDAEPGLITVDRKSGRIRIAKVAAIDSERNIAPERINTLIDDINQTRKEAGKTNFLEHVSKPLHRIVYGDHAVNGIKRDLRKGGVPERGTVMWY